jgi:crossover junction endodeoxyribonuclease RuvC
VVVLGIDPGSRRCGWAAVSRVGARLVALDSGVLAPGDLPLPSRLAALLDGLGVVLARTGADAVSVESAFCGISPRSALVLGHARGVALAAAARAGVPVFEYAPAAVKRAFTGSGRADKPQMVRTARQLLGVDPRLADEADAVAVAVCHLAHAAPALRAPKAGEPSAPARARAAAARLRPAVRRFGAAR